MKVRPTVFAIFLAFGCSASGQAISQWTFELNTPPDLTDRASGPSVNADFGNGTATGIHASAATDWTTPAGNGSANSFAANEWVIGDSYTFALSTVGFSAIFVTFDQMRSGTGPNIFNIQYSVDGGGSFTPFDSYGVEEANWNPSFRTSNTYVFNFSNITALNNNPTVAFRLLNTTTTAQPAGVARIDNFFVSAGAPIVPPIPEPSTTALIGAALGLLAIARGCKYRK